MGEGVTVGGAFYVTKYTGGYGITDGGGISDQVQNVSLSASRSSSIYGNSSTVQPNSVTMKHIIKY